MKALMCPPTHFDVLYQINPHMKPGTVDREKAFLQWSHLKNELETIGVQVQLINPAEGFPDMVFTANQSLPFVKDGKASVLLSKMASEERKGEVPNFKTWYESQGFDVFELPNGIGPLEGMGDTVFHEDKSFLWSAYGFRTSLKTHREIERITGLEVKSLRLIDPAFYHLDVCLVVLGQGVAMVYEPAFVEASLAKIKSEFKHLISLSRDEAYNFACNAFCPDQKHVFIHPGSTRIDQELKSHGFTPVHINTSEFIKSGGSVFCMKMELPS